MKAPADMASVQYTTPCRGVFSVHARTQAVHSSVGQAFCASFFEALLQKEGDGKWSRCRDSREEGRIGACWSKSGQPNIAHCVNLYFLERALHGSSSSLGLHLFLHIEKRKYLQCTVVQCGELWQLSKAKHFGNQDPIYDDRKKSFFRKPERKQ